MRKLDFWPNWLFITALVMTAFGGFMALFNRTPAFAIFTQQINPVFWPGGQLGPGVSQFQSWLYGVWGATVAGMGICVAFIARQAFARREKWARTTLLVAIGVWFILDTAVSLSARVLFNALFNGVVLILVISPLIFTWKEFDAIKVERSAAE